MVIDDSTQDIWGPKICTTGFSSGSGLSSRPSMVSSSLLPVVTSIFVDVMRGAPGCFRKVVPGKGMLSKIKVVFFDPIRQRCRGNWVTGR